MMMPFPKTPDPIEPSKPTNRAIRRKDERQWSSREERLKARADKRLQQRVRPGPMSERQRESALEELKGRLKEAERDLEFFRGCQRRDRARIEAQEGSERFRESLASMMESNQQRIDVLYGQALRLKGAVEDFEKTKGKTQLEIGRVYAEIQRRLREGEDGGRRE